MPSSSSARNAAKCSTPKSFTTWRLRRRPKKKTKSSPLWAAASARICRVCAGQTQAASDPPCIVKSRQNGKAHGGGQGAVADGDNGLWRVEARQEHGDQGDDLRQGIGLAVN